MGCSANLQNRHTFKKGETIERIAHRYQVSMEDLRSLNEWEDISSFLPTEIQINLSPKRGIVKAAFAYQRAYIPPARFMWPVLGRLSSPFGHRWGMMHNGIDIASPPGSPIRAAKGGKVIHSGRVKGYGNLVVVYHGGGYSTVYAHASKLLVRKGSRVKTGQRIALVGSTGRSTGPHLHFEVRRFKTATDPLRYLQRRH